VRPLRVLVADDSAFNRRTITDILHQLPNVEVIAKASDGDHALQLAILEKPDLVTLDIEMPRMDGFTFLKLLMARQPTPVIVVSGRAAKLDVFRALELGALEFVVKPSAGSPQELASIREELSWKVEMVRQMREFRTLERPVTSRFRAVQADAGRPYPSDPTPRKVFVIGASTGGPPALVHLFSRLASDLPISVLVAQHMPERFTRTFAERLERLSGLRVAEAEGRALLRAGTALIGPGGFALELQGRGVTASSAVAPTSPTDRYVPSVDRLFRTAAESLGPRAVAVILTGMGDDGMRGAQAIRDAGGTVIAESEETAAIFGMPGSVIRAGLAHAELPLHLIPERIIKMAREP